MMMFTIVFYVSYILYVALFAMYAPWRFTLFDLGTMALGGIAFSASVGFLVTIPALLFKHFKQREV